MPISSSTAASEPAGERHDIRPPGGTDGVGRAADAEAAIATEGAIAAENRDRRKLDRNGEAGTFDRPVDLEAAPGVARGDRIGDRAVGKAEPVGDLGPGEAFEGGAGRPDGPGEIARKELEPPVAVEFPEEPVGLQARLEQETGGLCGSVFGGHARLGGDLADLALGKDFRLRGAFGLELGDDHRRLDVVVGRGRFEIDGGHRSRRCHCGGGGRQHRLGQGGFGFGGFGFGGLGRRFCGGFGGQFGGRGFLRPFAGLDQRQRLVARHALALAGRHPAFLDGRERRLVFGNRRPVEAGLVRRLAGDVVFVLALVLGSLVGSDRLPGFGTRHFRPRDIFLQGRFGLDGLDHGRRGDHRLRRGPGRGFGGIEVRRPDDQHMADLVALDDAGNAGAALALGGQHVAGNERHLADLGIGQQLVDVGGDVGEFFIAAGRADDLAIGVEDGGHRMGIGEEVGEGVGVLAAPRRPGQRLGRGDEHCKSTARKADRRDGGGQRMGAQADEEAQALELADRDLAGRHEAGDLAGGRRLGAEV
ncbi:MAG TPA: hypothetical protein PLJ34_02905, partial [Hyphomicrobiales bacterium]|nr:hypothetical protein [Hyphomicrobiales bacterium]